MFEWFTKMDDERSEMNNTNEEIPKVSEWEYYFGIPIFWHYKGENIIRLGYYRFRIFPFYALIILGLLIYLYWYHYSYPFLAEDQKKSHFYFITICFALSVLCDFTTRTVNPGFVPFNWCENRKMKFTDDEIRKGKALSDEQTEWAKNQEFPPRAFFSGSYGWGVLKADHVCYYLDCWVGIHNMKYYLLGMLYGGLYLLGASYSNYIGYHNDPVFSKKNMFYYLFILCVSLFFMVFHFNQLFNGIFRIIINYTFVEKTLKCPRNYDRGIINNFEEIFGTIKLFPLWFLPIPFPKSKKNGFDYPIQEKEQKEENL